MEELTKWVEENLKDYLQDIVEHGCMGGFPGITYYKDTEKLFEEHKDEIFDKLADDTENHGYSNIYEFMATWNKDAMPWTYYQFANQLIWYAVEEIARELLGE